MKKIAVGKDHLKSNLFFAFNARSPKFLSFLFLNFDKEAGKNFVY